MHYVLCTMRFRYTSVEYSVGMCVFYYCYGPWNGEKQWLHKRDKVIRVSFKIGLLDLGICDGAGTDIQVGRIDWKGKPD